MASTQEILDVFRDAVDAQTAGDGRALNRLLTTARMVAGAPVLTAAELAGTNLSTAILDTDLASLEGRETLMWLLERAEEHLNADPSCTYTDLGDRVVVIAARSNDEALTETATWPARYAAVAVLDPTATTPNADETMLFAVADDTTDTVVTLLRLKPVDPAAYVGVRELAATLRDRLLAHAPGTTV